MRFNYQARTKEGEIQSGVVEASSQEAALTLLQKHDLFVTYLEEVEAAPFYARKIEFLERVSRKDLVMFSRQLSIMFKSEVPLVEALRVLGHQSENPAFREKILKISEDVEGGTPFSQALSRFPKIFSPLFISIVKSGEASGTLSASLSYLADHLEREYHLQSKIMLAMFYPAFVLLVMGVVLLIMMFFVLPQLTTILKESGQELPLFTKILIFLTDFLRQWGLFLFIAFLAVIAFFFYYSRTPEGKKNFDKFSLKIPFLGSLLKTIYLSRFAENLSTLIAGGIPIARALEITAEIVGNETYQKIISQAKEEVKRGEPISRVLTRYPEAFPPLFTQMTIIGEKTGTLDKSLMNVVKFYQEEVDRNVETMVSLLEPILIVFLGLGVAIFMIGILMPLYQITSLG